MSENNNNNNFNNKKPAANLGNAVTNMATTGNKNSIRMNKPSNSMNKSSSNSMNKSSSSNGTNTNYDEENNEENDFENETKKVSLTGSAATANAIANSATMGTTNSLNSLNSPSSSSSSSSASINNFSKNKGNKIKNNNKKKSNTKIMTNNSYKNLTLKNTLGEDNANENAGETPIENAEENTLENLVNNNNKTSGVGVNNKTSQNVGEESTNVESKLEPTNNNKGKNNLEKLASLNRVCMNLINHQVVMKLFHFQTDHYGSHKTSDAYIEKYSNTFDKFLEIAQGIYGKITLKKYSLVGSSHNDENIVKHLEGMITYWRTKMDDILGNYTDLINIRDELVGDAEQMKYLLTFK